ncbi:TetR/AcrR family transcriptional regulator [Actinomadura keratinilytica]|jgi:TetR/AcrR family transcriptional repressor of nem operon|uniref:TetR/AcrR family transcriptional regulator n=1 Tax=Actinomadura keratinilytica TaxID=547461 RepID=A0ABP7Z5N9_9ACTN
MTQRQELSHKERLLRHGMMLFYAQGFHGTTVDAILESAKVPKGSFYHHFGSKEAFGQAVLDRYRQFQEALLAAWEAREGLTTGEKLGGYFTEMIDIFVGSDYQRACLAGKFSTEVSASSAGFRERIGHDLDAWRDRIAALLRRGQEAGDVRADRSADDLANAILSLIQGAFVIALSTRDETALRGVASTMAMLISPPACTSTPN